MPQVVREQPFDFAPQRWIEVKANDRAQATSFNRPEILLRIDGDVSQGNASRLTTLAEESAEVSHERVWRLRQRLSAFNASLQFRAEPQVTEQRQFEVPRDVVRIDAVSQELQGSCQEVEHDDVLLPLFGQASHQLNHVRRMPICVEIGAQRQVGGDSLRASYHVQVATLHQHEV